MPMFDDTSQTVSLVIYLGVLVTSAALAVVYLFVRAETRLRA